MNYCRASFEIVTRIRSDIRLPVKNETTFISAKKSCRCWSEQYFRSYKLYNRVAPFFWPTLYNSSVQLHSVTHIICIMHLSIALQTILSWSY